MHQNLHLKLKYLLKSEITELYITHALRSFALSTIAIFIPIFFLTKGYAVLEILIFYAIYEFFSLIVMYVALKHCSIHGAKRTIAFSIPFHIAFFVLLYAMDTLILRFGSIGALVAVGFTLALASPVYFSGFHIDFARLTDKSRSAKQVSIIHALGMFFSIVGPLVGGIVITYLSFQVLFGIIISVLFFAIIPLFASGEIHESFKFSLKKAFSFSEVKRSYVFAAEGIRDYAARIFWPILLFFLAISATQMGGIFTFSNALLALFTIYLGRKVHDKNKSRILNWGATMHAISLAARTLLKTISAIAIVQGFGAISASMVEVPFQSTFYNNSRRRGIASTIYSRELFLRVGRISLSLLLILLISIFALKTSFVIAIMVGALATVFMSRIKEEPESSI